MKNLKERQLAKEVLKKTLRFNVTLSDVIPLESDHIKGQCVYVLFNIRGNNKISYRASKALAFGVTTYRLVEEVNSNGSEIIYTVEE